jgi:hypothetical protein
MQRKGFRPRLDFPSKPLETDFQLRALQRERPRSWAAMSPQTTISRRAGMHSQETVALTSSTPTPPGRSTGKRRSSPMTPLHNHG